MIFPLKYNTASQEVPLGFFLDTSTGNLEQTGLTINNTDIKLWKSGATTLANKNSGGATHISNGIYYCVLDATDTNTYGPLEIFVHVTGALSFHKICTVINTDAYDALMSASSGSLRSTVTDKTGFSLSVTPPTAQNIWEYGTRVLTSSGSVVVATNNDKTGYSLSGGVTVTTNNDKTGYTVSTVTDKTGYSLSVTPPTAQNIWEYNTRVLTSSGLVSANVTQWDGSAVLTPTSSGVPLVRVTSIADNVITDAAIASDAEYTLEQIGGAVWDIQRSSHTSTGTFGEYVNVQSSSGSISEAYIAGAVWNALRTNYADSGSFGQGAASVQGNVTGSVNSVTSGVTVTTNNDKTGYTVSTVTDKTGYSLSVTPPTAQNIWEYGTRVLTSSGAVVVATNNDKTGYTVSTVSDKTGYSLSVTPPTAQNIWEYNTRVLTSTGSTSVDYDQVADAVWDAQRSSHTSTGTFGEYVNVQSSSGSISEAYIAGAVWNALRINYADSGSFGQGAASVQGNVTGSVGTITNPVTAGTVTDKTGYSLSVTPPTAQNIWEYNTRVLTSSGAVTVSDKTGFSGIVTDKTGFSLVVTPPTAQNIWEYNTRVLTSSGSATVDYDQVAGAVWNAQRSSYTSTGTFGEGVAVSGAITLGDIIDGIWDEPVSNHTSTGTTGKALTSTGTVSIDPADIWSYTTRTLTSAGIVWDALRSSHTSTGTFGEGVAVSGAMTLGDVIDGVWDEPRVDHTDSGTFGEYVNVQSSSGNISEAFIANAVWNAQKSTHTSTGSFGESVNVDTIDIWEYPTRTLTSSGVAPVDPASIWTYTTRTLTSSGSVPIDAADVWSYATRTLTSTGTSDATLANQIIIINHLIDIKGAGWVDENLVGIMAAIENGTWGGYFI
jgi:hypothetical protein